MFFHFIYPLSVVTFGFDKLVTVCLHVWGAKERERSIKNFWKRQTGRKKVRGRTDSGGNEKKRKEICISNAGND